ncbi:MAG TPA: YqiA/YcfP family alpha/beta fold hydrolase [Bryobacteraceae bacterium]|nr:YqiA/YcfP family alpha/beta fold hydrolase [Bryobacteraceae bacterium]
MPPILIYLHGFASSPSSHKARFFRAQLADVGLHLEVPDLAEGDFEHLTITRQLAVIDRLARDRPALLIGSSMGGYLAALYAVRHTQVRRLVLLAPAFGFLRRWPESFGAQRVEQWRRTGSLDVYHYGDRRTRRLGYQILEDGRLYEDYPAVAQPVLVFHGAQDAAVPVEYSREFCAGHPNARLEVLASDHELLNVLPHIWEQSRQFLIDGLPDGWRAPA